jgi:nardilysin
LGPDLNASKSPLDSKVYELVALPNGLRCLLIDDTAAASGGRSGAATDYNDGDSSESPSDGDREDDMASDDEDDDESATSVRGMRDAAACVLVGVGSADDPPACQGLAHFLEHLLFMGSSKYPNENEYDEFVSKRGGSANAYTEWEHTVYSFRIPQPHLFGALDRLAQFFVEPLLQLGSVDRELQAIESEFNLHRNSDSTRWQQLVSATAPPSHPLSKFGWGNLRTLQEIPKLLGIDPVRELRRFYDRHYCASNMVLVVVGAYPLEEMRCRVGEIFGPVPSLPRDRGAEPATSELCEEDGNNVEVERRLAIGSPSEDPWLYRNEMIPDHPNSPISSTVTKVIRTIPVKDTHVLRVTWSLPSRKHPDPQRRLDKSGDFLSHLLGHEGSGSVFSYLRRQTWATSCEASCGSDGDGLSDASTHALFTLRFSLSQEGMERHWKDVLDAVYVYLGMLRLQCQLGWPPWMFEELQRVAELSYVYRDEPSTDDLVEELAETMAPHNRVPLERILDGNYRCFNFDPDAIRDLLDNHLTPRNARIDLSSSLWGRASDYEDGTVTEGPETKVPDLREVEETLKFDLKVAGPPLAEPMFGTRFWCSSVPIGWLEAWERLSSPSSPDLPFRLPDPNPYVPTALDLKTLPEDDSHHPLLSCSLKLCVPVGKKKQWLPATAIRYNRTQHAVLVTYEGGLEQRWHQLDEPRRAQHHRHHRGCTATARPDMEGTFDNRSIRYRVLSTSGVGLFGDDSDDAVQDGKLFPPIPPAPSEGRLPRPISSTNLLKLWWLQDRHYHRPIADLRVRVVCAAANKSPLHRACADLVKLLCVDALVEDSYLADVCDLSYSIGATDVGFAVAVNGFDHKLLELFERVMSVFLSFAGRCDSENGTCDVLPPGIAKERFHSCVEILHRKYENSDMKASALCSTVRVRAFRPTVWSAHQLDAALETADVHLFARTSRSLLEKFAIEALYHGNVDRSDAEAARDLILSLVGKTMSGDSNNDKTPLPPGLPRKKYPSESVLRIPPSLATPTIVVPSKDTHDPNTAVEVYIQIGKDNVRDRVLVDLLVQILNEPFFDQVRTKDQFGYDCFCDSRWSYGIIGMVFHVVTNVKSAQRVVDRVNQFLSESRSRLLAPALAGGGTAEGGVDAGMSDDEFLEHKVALATEKLDSFDSLGEETDSYWEEIRIGRFEWQAWRNEAVELQSVSRDDVVDAFDRWLSPSSARLRPILAVQVIGSGPGDVSSGRPAVEVENYGPFIDEQVSSFHSLCKNQFF